MTMLEADVVVVGSGPGGATVARQLARAGQRVVLLERGHDYRGDIYYGSHLGALIYADKNSLLFTDEGLNIIRPIMTGGATNMYCGCCCSATGVAQGALRRGPRLLRLGDHPRAEDPAPAG